MSGHVLREARASGQAAWHWWTGEMRQLLPARLRGASGEALVVRLEGGGLSVGRDTATGWHELAVPLASGTAVATLRLPDAMVLRRRVMLAAAAAENLHEAVGFQLDRFTPFETDEVYFGCSVAGHDEEAEAVGVDLAVALKADVDALLAKATARGIVCCKVVPEGLDTPALRIGAAQARRAPGGRTGVLWALAAMLLLADLAAPLLRGHAVLTTLHGQETLLRREALAVANLRDQVEQDTGQAAIPLQRRRDVSLLAVLAEVTRLMPDSSWVTSLQFQDGTVQLNGSSAAANALIPLLERSPMLANAQFRSPVTQDPVHGGEQFFLSADLRPRSDP